MSPDGSFLESAEAIGSNCPTLNQLSQPEGAFSTVAALVTEGGAWRRRDQVFFTVLVFDNTQVGDFPTLFRFPWDHG
jgi:hypothetical protein